MPPGAVPATSRIALAGYAWAWAAAPSPRRTTAIRMISGRIGLLFHGFAALNLVMAGSSMHSRKTPSVTRGVVHHLMREESLMCYEFDELYRKMREEDALRKKQAQDGKDKSPAPAKPAPAVKPREPVPA